ncbi:MAG: AsmA family protein [Hyphomicrobiales bacterium]
MARVTKPVLKKGTVQGILALLALLAFAACIGFIEWPISSDRAERKIRDRIAGSIGETSLRMGPIRLSLLPFPRLAIADLVLSKDSGFTLIAPRVDVSLNPTALLLGNFDPGLFRLFDAVIELPSDRIPTTPSETAALAVALINTYTPTPTGISRSEPFDVRLVNGTVRGRERPAASGLVSLFAELSGDPAGSLSIAGEGIWRGKKLTAVMASGAPSASGESRRGVTVDVSSDFGHVTLDGEMDVGPVPQFNGLLTSRITDVGLLSREIGLLSGVANSIDLAISGASRISSEGVMLSDAEITLGKMMFGGALHFRQNEDRTKIVATLAAEDIDATDALRPYWPKVDVGSGWKKDAPDKSILSTFDLDLRISVERADLGVARVSDVALSLLASEGKFDATLASAKIFNGSVKARLTLTEAADGPALKLHCDFGRIDSGAALLALMNSRHFEGLTNGSLTVESIGTSAEILMKNLSGSGEFTVENGIVSGINVEGILKRAETRPLSLAGNLGGGSTEFDRIVFRTRIADGAAEIIEADVEAPNARVTMTGTIDIGKRHLEVKGEARRPPNTAGGQPTKLPFSITGTFDEPELEADIVKILRESE